MEIQLLHRKDSLILTAIDVINELGIQGLSTREIAKRQNVSEATMFRHYKTKNELLMAVLDYFVQYDMDIVKSAKIKKMTPREAIIYCINALMEYYHSYPAITSIPQVYEVLSGDVLYADKVRKIQMNRLQILQEFIEQAKVAGEIKNTADSGQLAVVIMGYCRQEILNWRLEAYSYDLKEKTMSTLSMVLNAFK